MILCERTRHSVREWKVYIAGDFVRLIGILLMGFLTMTEKA